MSVNIAEWFPKVFYQMGDTLCPTEKIAKAVVLTLQDFCVRTQLWQQELDRISVVADTKEYALSHTSGDIISVSNVLYKLNTAGGVIQDSLGGILTDWMGDAITDGTGASASTTSDDQFKKLTPTSKFLEDEISADSWNFQTAATPTKFYIGNNKKIYLVPTPTEASTEGLLVGVYLKPLSAAATVEDFFYTDHQEIITIGAVSKLLSEANTPRTDMDTGFRKELEFISRCNDVLGIKTTGYTNRPLKVRFKRFV